MILSAETISSEIAPVVLRHAFVGFVHSVLERNIFVGSSHQCIISIGWIEDGMKLLLL